MEIESHRFHYKTSDVAYYTIGSGKPLIILHGWGSSSSVMAPLAKRLSEHRLCTLIDFPGFGDSPEPPAAWAIKDYSDLVVTFIKEKYPDTPVDMLVHSFGGRVLLKILSTDPRQPEIEKMVITGGAGLKPKRSLTYHLKRFVAKILKLPASFVPASKREAMLERIRQTRAWKALGSSDYSKLSGVMRETFVKSVTEFFDDKLSTIDDEILLLWGEDDAATPLDQAKRLDVGLKNSALVTIENAGHYAFLDQPARFTSIVRAYLEG